MNLRQMEAFQAVMLTGSISLAADRLHKTQPAVSMAIAALEDDIGFELFERRKKRLHPTPEAKYLYAEVQGIFTRIHDVSQTIEDIRNKQVGFLRLGCMPGPSIFFLPDLISDFLALHPEVRVSMQTRTSEGVREWTASAQYDLGLAEVAASEPGLEKEDWVLRCVCAVPADHALAAEPVLTPRLLDNQPMITLYADNMTFHELTKRFDSAKKRLNVRLQTRFFIPALRFVERGLGVCVMDPISVVSYRSYANPGRIVFRPFEPEIPFRVGIVYPPGTPRSRITVAFSERLRLQLSTVASAPITGASW